MMQAEEAMKVAGGNKENSRDQIPAVTEDAQKTFSEAITASTTAMVAGAISKPRERNVKPNAPEGIKPHAPSTSEIAGDVPSAQGHTDDQRVGALADPGARTSPRATKSGGDLRSSFLAAVGNTISQTEPLGVPKINPDESSSSSGEESQPPVQLLRHNRRASSITRAGNMALSLSSTKPSEAAAASSPANASSPTAAGAKPASASADGRMRRVQFDEMDESVKRLLLISPAYPGGISGRMTMDRSGPASRSPASPSGGNTSGNKRKRYKMVFNEDREKQHSATTAAAELRHDPAGATPGWRGLPAGLEAVPHETDPTMLCVRELGPPGASDGGGVNGGGTGRVVAQIGATTTTAGGRESIHSVVLAIEGGGGGGGVTGELMAVRVSTHPTRLAAPREVHAVLLLPRDGEDLGRGTHAQGMSGMPVWDSGSASRSDGLWEAAAAGRVGGGAAAVVELHSKTAVWSSTTKSFELDVLEAWRPGQIDVGRTAAAAAGTVTSSQPAPETMQMVSTPDDNLSSARSGNSSARGGAGGGHERQRIPSVQLAKLKNTGIGDSWRVEAGGSSGDDDGNTKRTSSEGGQSGSIERASGDPADAKYEFSWVVAVAAPVPPLHGFCLAVVGLETGMVGAAVTLVDRSVEAAAEQAAVGFLGFDEALTQDRKGSPTAGDGIPPKSARIEQQPQQQQQRKDESNRSGKDLGSMPAVPALALGVVAATAKASGSGRRSSASRSSRRPSPGRGGREAGDNSSDARSSRTPTTNSRANPTDSLKNSLTGTLQKRSVDQEAGAAGQQEVGGLAGGDIKGGGRGDEGKAAAARPDRQAMAPGGGVAWTATAGGTVPVPVKRRMSVQVAAAKIVEKVYRNTYVCNLCLLTLTVSFTADLYPGAPSHNVPMSAALLWACSNVDGVRALRRRSFAYALSVVVLLSLFMDIDFLASDLKAYALSRLEEEDDDLQRVIVEKNMHTFGRVIVGIVAGLKALSWQGLLATSPQGIHALNLLWRRFKLFVPIWGSPRKLTKEVYNRVVALAWLHLLAAVTLMIIAGVAGMGFEWAPQFASSQGAGIPLATICFLKSLTNLLVSAALFRNMDLALCLNVFGCLACFQGWHLAREQRRRARHGVTYPKVVLEWDYIMMCGYVKIFDLMLGLWLWIGLGWAWNEDRDYSERHNIRMLLVAITTVQTLTDVWSVFLGIAVSLLVSQYLLRKEKSAAAASNAFGEQEGLDRDVEIARSLSTGRLLASPASPTSQDSSSSVDGGRRGRGKDEDDIESSDDSYSTGESDTESDESSPRSRKPARTSAAGVQLGEASGNAVGNRGRGNNNNDSATVVVATAQPAQGAWPLGNATADSSRVGEAAPRRRSMFAPGGNRLVYKRAFSARSSSDDSAVGGDNNSSGGVPPPEAISLDRSFVTTADDFSSAWDSLRTCASFRCRIGRLPEAETLAVHFREQGFVVVASGVVGDGRTKIYACARGVGVEALFYAELVFEKEMHELEFTFKCQDERLTSRFVCHMHLRRVIGDHQPIA